MKIHGFFTYQLIVLFAVQGCVNSKTLFKKSVSENDVSDNAESVNSAIKNLDASTSLHAEEEEENQPSAATLKLPKINTQGTQCYDVPSSKRSTDDNEVKSVNHAYSRYKRRRSPYGIVFNQGKPIGILEPISRMYEFQDFQKSHAEEDERSAVKREMESDLKQPYAGLIEERGYSNLKNDNRIKFKQLGEETSQLENDKKRDKTLKKRSADKIINDSKTKREVSDKNLMEIENNLKEIMNDLGLINGQKDKIKREALSEDEDLDSGLNKIGLTKELHAFERNKKEERSPPKAAHNNDKQARKDREPDRAEDTTENNNNKKAKKNKMADYRSEGESFIRKKREQAKSGESSDIMKGLESSGDLTISGNKSPLASSSTASTESDPKHKVSKTEKDEKRDKQMEEQEFEKRIQRNIEKKITTIKDQVKREIKALKEEKIAETKKVAEPKKRDTSVEDKKKREEKNDKKDSKSREKRNLLDKETDEINPDKNIDDALEPHIRKRRDLNLDVFEAEDSETQQNDDKEVQKNNRVTWHEMNDNEKSIGDINKREGIEKSEPIKKTYHLPSSYEFTYRTKRKDSEMEDSSKQDKNDELKDLSKRNFKDSDSNDKKIGENDSGFWDVQNQNVARTVDNPATRVVVTRESETKNAPVAAETKSERKSFDNEKLEKLVSDSSFLIDSFKTERGTRSGSPNIEVELHTGRDSKSQKAKKSDDVPLRQKEDDKLGAEDKHDDIDRSVATGDQLAEGNIDNKLQVKRFAQMHGTDLRAVLEPKESAFVEDKVVGDVPARPKSANNRFKVFEGPVAKLSRESNLANTMEANLAEERAKSHGDTSKLADVEQNDVSKREDVMSGEQVGEKRKRSIPLDNKAKQNSKLLAESHTYTRLGRSSENIRQERHSEPSMSLEDMQRLDSENNSKRKRRQADYFFFPGREKRDDNYPEPNNMQFKTYRGDDEEADDESDEFDDDNFDDRTANLVRKRATGHDDNSNYDDFDEDYEQINTNVEGQKNARVNKRNAFARNYVANMNSDVYDNPNYLYGVNSNMRKKRHINDLAALHSGGPMMRHLAAAKERSMQPVDNLRKKRLEKLNQKPYNKDQTITGLSESDIFGGLPQSYEGELSRFKRVKRDDHSLKSN